MLQPELEDKTTIDMSSGIASVLGEIGLVETPAQKAEAEKELSGLQKIMRDRGCSIDDAMETISNVMENGRMDTKLRAAEIVLKAQGIFNDRDKKQPTNVIIVVNNSFGGEQKNLTQLIMPNAQ